MITSTNSNFPEHRTNIIDEFGKLSGYLHEDVEKFGGPKTRALFDIPDEVITGLQTAFTNFEKENEPAWK